jgi:putative heme transporter
LADRERAEVLTRRDVMDAAEPVHPGAPAASQRARGEPPGERLVRAGRRAWALLGIALAAAAGALVAGQLAVVLIPVVLALFPAALLHPVAAWLKRRRVRPALAALGVVVGALLLLAALVAALVPIVAAQAPDLVESLGEGIGELEEAVAAVPGVEGMRDLLDQAREQVGEAGELARRTLTAATVVVEGVIGILLALVVLFFYLKDGERIAAGLRDTMPARWRPHAEAIGIRAWSTVGSYFRGQLLVAVVDAVVIGIGLVLLGIPLAVPLAVLIFFGGLFPIVGAVVTGALAVVVALADAGLLTALIVLGLVLAVQQLESNVLEPYVLGRVIALHPLLVVLSITAGAAVLGILGAFLAVPVTAATARAIDYWRGRAEPAAAGAD